jgi:hypothetical protein
MTPIEKLIKEFETLQMTCSTIQERVFFDGVLGILDAALPTEAEHTKQVGTGFGEWLNNSNQYRPVGYNNYRNVAGKIFTIPELWDEYILTIQNNTNEN